VYLRARWYDAGEGVFTARDPWKGCLRTPYSQHPYQYGYSDPTGNTDPSGECVISLYYWEVGGTFGHYHIDVLVNECGPLPDHGGACTNDPESSLRIYEGHPTGGGNIIQGLFECVGLSTAFRNLTADSFSWARKNERHDFNYAPADELAQAIRHRVFVANGQKPTLTFSEATVCESSTG
jgi:hypothetical protein